VGSVTQAKNYMENHRCMPESDISQAAQHGDLDCLKKRQCFGLL